jgi:hypothetical protein
MATLTHSVIQNIGKCSRRTLAIDMWGPWATFPGIDGSLSSHGDYTFNSGPASYSAHLPLRGKRQKGIKHANESRLYKGCQHHSQMQGAAQTVTLHISEHTNHSLITRGPLQKRLQQKGFMKHAKRFLLQFICSSFYYLISYGLMNNSEILILFQFV